MAILCLRPFLLIALAGGIRGPPSFDDLWAATAHFASYANFTVNAPTFSRVDAGTRVVVVGSTWYLFGRSDMVASPHCPNGEISVNVRASLDRGTTWGAPSVIASPDEASTCIYADGGGFFDADTGVWHYLVQVLGAGANVSWGLAHFSRTGASPLGAWAPNARNPVVRGGDLFNKICAGAGKHCEVGMVDEGTPEIVEKVGADFYVTFHGYDYARRRAARGVARTADFVTWETTGGLLPGDVIFSHQDCAAWDVPWAAGGCIGSGEASVLRGPSGFLYQVIEAADKDLVCETGWNAQWWPLGLVRAKTWAPSPQWEQMAMTPFVGGPAGGQPHVGCSIQYNSLHRDTTTGATYMAFWDVSFHPANATVPFQRWHVYELVWGQGALPIPWPGPPQAPPALPDCSSRASCKATCPGYVECAADGAFYCCADTVHCAAVHDCTSDPGLHYCACSAS
jgi:hypothetical protein